LFNDNYERKPPSFSFGFVEELEVSAMEKLIQCSLFHHYCDLIATTKMDELTSHR
jgi:hypothetical protein